LPSVSIGGLSFVEFMWRMSFQLNKLSWTNKASTILGKPRIPPPVRSGDIQASTIRWQLAASPLTNAEGAPPPD
jgi:hypothetical protein